jgi:hypothetical protein
MRPRTICFQRKTYPDQYGGAGRGEKGCPVEVKHKIPSESKESKTNEY